MKKLEEVKTKLVKHRSCGECTTRCEFNFPVCTPAVADQSKGETFSCHPILKYIFKVLDAL